MLKALQQFFQQSKDTEQPALPSVDGLTDTAFLSLVLMTEVSLADGELSTPERQHLKQALKNEYDVNDEQAEKALTRAVESATEASSLYEFTAHLKALEYEQRVNLLETLWAVAYADNELDPYEESLLRKLADLLYVSHADFIRAKLKITDA